MFAGDSANRNVIGTTPTLSVSKNGQLAVGTRTDITTDAFTQQWTLDSSDSMAAITAVFAP